MPDARVGINKPLPDYTLDVSGSVGLTSALYLKPSNPLPSGSIGALAVSQSSLYFYNGAWTLII